MRCNMSRIDVNLRRISAILAAGVGAFVLAIGYHLAGAVLLVVAAYLLVTAMLRFAPEYIPFHFRTKDRARGPVRR